MGDQYDVAYVRDLEDALKVANEALRGGVGTFNAEEWIAWASLTGPIREAIYMSDHGQDCVCSEQGKCYMHAQQERAEAALENLRQLFARVEWMSPAPAEDGDSNRMEPTSSDAI